MIAATLFKHAESNPDGIAFRFLDARGLHNATFTYSALAQNAARIAGGLLSHGLPAGQPTVIGCADPKRFMLAFLGVSIAGGIPVPVPAKGRRRNRLQQIVADCSPFAIILDEETAQVWRGDQSLKVLTLSELESSPSSFDNQHATDPAFIQYTSGSTGSPKGVVVTQQQLLANSNMIAKAFGHDETTRFAGWVPLFHDMGLVGAALHPLLIMAEAVLMPPEGFIGNPHLWLRMISEYGASTSGAPDFAYRACVDSSQDLLDGLDLSSWRVAYVGAELIRADTLRMFEEAMAPYGFDPSAWLPCYGMAETTLLASGISRHQTLLSVNKVLSADDGAANDANGSSCLTREVFSVGPATPNSTIRIVSTDKSIELQEGQLGEVWIAGDHVSQRYWNHEQDLRDGRLASCGSTEFLRTGDLGFMQDGELFIVGRSKTMIIINGRNVYPFDIEVAAGEHPGLRRHRAIAVAIDSESFAARFGVSPNSVLGNELPVLIAEVEQGPGAKDRTRIAQDVAEIVRDSCEVDLCAVVLVERGGIEVTTSGKLRHKRAVEKLLNDEYRSSLAWLSPLVSAAADGSIGRLADAISGHAPTESIAELIGKHFSHELLLDKALPTDTLLTESGISSLGLMNVSAQLSELTGLRIPVEILYSELTIYDLAQHLVGEFEKSAQADSENAQFPMPQLSFGGETILRRRVEVGDAAYVLAFSVTGPRRIIREVCTEALLLPRAFQSLRLRADSGGEPWYFPDNDTDPPLQKLGAFTDTSSRDNALNQVTREPFDLSLGPLRIALASGPDQESSLLVMVHHAAADFWTMAAIVKQLADASRGIAVPRLERRWKDESLNPEHCAYWKSSFVDWEYTALPRDCSGPAGGVPRCAQFAISAEVLKKLKRHTRQTSFVIATTILGSAIARWSGSWDRVIGVPVAGSLDGSGGYRVKIVPVRISLAANQSFDDAVKIVGGQIGDAMANRNIPLEQIRSEFLVSRPGLVDLFETAVVHLSASKYLTADTLRLALRQDDSECYVNGVRFSTANLGPHALELPMEIVTCEIDGAVEGVIRLDGGLFSQTTADWLARSISLAANSASLQPDSGLAFLVDRDQEPSMLQASGELSVDSANTSLHGLLDAQAKRRASSAAIESDSMTVRYDELVEMANSLAAAMLERHMTPQKVAIHCESQRKAIVGIFSALKAGALVVPIDPSLPADRQQAILSESDVDVVLCDGAFPIGAEPRSDIVQIQITDELLRNQAVPISLPDVPGDHPAYLLFTSGSTGTPKGINQTHETFTHFIAWQASALQIDNSSRVAQVAAPGFDVALCEIFGGLCCGAALVLPRRPQDLAPDRLFAWLEETSTSVLQVTSSLLSAAMKASDAWPSSLRTVANVGEPLPVSLADEIIRRGGASIRLINIYGPTETVAASWHHVTQADLQRQRIPAGRPIAGRTLEIRDENGQLLPRGMRGEIFIKSRYMSNGYAAGLDNSGGFLIPPLESSDGCGFYKTGDLGRMTDEGLLEVSGRRDNQVKLNGIRIELEEVELALHRHRAVTAAIAMVEKEGSGPSRLLAAVEAPTGTKSAAVRAEVLKVLPTNFVPAFIFVVPSLPRTVNGKVNRQQFSKCMMELVKNENTQSEYVGSMSDTDKYVAKLWSQIIPGATAVNPNSNFFACGGNSIIAMQLLNQIHSETGTHIALAGFLAAPTVSALSEVIGDAVISETAQ